MDCSLPGFSVGFPRQDTGCVVISFFRIRLVLFEAEDSCFEQQEGGIPRKGKLESALNPVPKGWPGH